MFRIILPLFILTTLLLSDSRVYTVAFPKNFYPYFITTDNQFTGYGIELFEALAKEANIKFEYHPQENWKDTMALAKANKIDLIPNSGISDARRDYLSFSRPVSSFAVSLYSLKGKEVRSLESLKGKKVAVLKTNVARKIVGQHKDIKLIVFNDKYKAFDAFVNQEVDYFAYPEPNAKKMAKERGVLNKISKNFDIKIIHRALAVTKQNSELLDQIELALQQLDNNGTLDAIYKKWHKEQVVYTFKDLMIFVSIAVVILLFIVGLLAYKRVFVSRNSLQKEVDNKTRQLKEQLDKFNFTAETALNGFWEWNVDKNILTVSPKWYETFGYEFEEFDTTVENVFNAIHKEDLLNVEQAVNATLEDSKKVYRASFRFQDKKGKYVWVQAAGTIYINNDNERIFFGYHLDLTSIKELEEKRAYQENVMLQNAKLASLGELLENIAHQWRQPLSIISTTASGMQVQQEAKQLNEEILDQELRLILKTTEELSLTIERFRNYFRKLSRASDY